MSRVLVIGDLHLPFCLDGYFEFCVSEYKKWKCNRVVFIGDIIDNHFASYHENDTNCVGGFTELDAAIIQLRKWYKKFPKADVLIGNHDRMAFRKAQTGKIPLKWIRGYADTLEVPKWEFVENLIIDDTLYIHGEGVTAYTKALREMMSVVQGHRHTEMYVKWHYTRNGAKFGMQVGCGVDSTSYGMTYAKNYPPPALGCGVIIDGRFAFNCPYHHEK